MKAGWREAGLDGRRAAICLYAEKSTLTPSAMAEADLAPLRAEGLADADLLTLAHVSLPRCGAAVSSASGRLHEEFAPVFARAEEVVSRYFSARKDRPSNGTIEIFGERYVLVRAAALSVEFFTLVEGLFGAGREAEAGEFARNILFDLAHAIGRADAKSFHAKMGLEDPIERLSAGPVHFSHSGWAFVDISPESRPSPDDDYFLLYDHPYSFEADAWIEGGHRARFPACVMNSGYSSGWCEASFGVTLVASEILCRAMGDEACRFIMAPPGRIEGHIERHLADRPRPDRRPPSYQIPSFFSRKRSEEELRRSEEQYRGVFEASLDGIVIADTNGVFVDVNPAACAMHGFTREEMIGLTGRDIVRPDSLPKFAEFVRKVSGGETFRTEAVELRKDGSSFDIEVLGTPFLYQGRPHLLAILRDITQRKRAEEVLHLTQFSVDHAADSWFWTGPDARFVYVNDAACHSLGYTREELLSMTVHDIDPNFPAEAWPAHWEELRRNGSLVIESAHRSKDGRVRPVEIAVNYLRYGGREYNFAFARDVTERLRLEEQLRHSQKMQAVGSLAGGVAHDFNNLLTAISGYSDLLLRKMPDEDPLRSKVVQIRKASSRATSLTRQLLAFSRRQMLTPRILDVNRIVSGLAPMLRRLIGENIDLVTVLDPDLGRVKADKGQIEQVIMNLAVNARDAMPEGGRLTVETGTVDLDEQLAGWNRGLEPGQYVRIRVTDTGEGMDEETRARVFEPFFTTKKRDTSTGLGLSTVYGIVRQSDGRVGVESVPEAGTTFTVLLPTVDEPLSRDDPEGMRADSPGGPCTILLVEDEKGVQELAIEILRMSGYSVLTADSAEEALTVTGQHEGPIDVLLTDVVLPGMNGADLAGRLEAMRPKMKVLFMSGYTDDVIAHRGVLAPDIPFLAKPFSPDELVEKVRKVQTAPLSR